jgi:hypothetical protein
MSTKNKKGSGKIDQGDGATKKELEELQRFQQAWAKIDVSIIIDSYIYGTHINL